MKKRLPFIDIARAFAIIFIVLGHTLVHSSNCGYVFKFLYSFHVVLFFVISGYTFKIKEEESFPNFLKNKFLRIVMPYLLWALLFLIPYLILGQNINDSIGTNSSFNIKTQILNILYGNGNLSALKQNSSLWFLPALFSMEIVYYFIIKITNKILKIELPVLCLLIVIGFSSSLFLKFYFPWGINTVLNIGYFFFIGYLLKKYDLLRKEKIGNIKYIAPLFLMGMFACFLNKEIVSCIEYSYGNYGLAILSGICLSCTTLYIAYKIKENKWLEYIGRNTMGILLFHKIIILVFQTKLGLISKMLRNSNIYIELSLSLIVSFISIVISLIITYIIKKFAPLTIGEKSK